MNFNHSYTSFCFGKIRRCSNKRDSLVAQMVKSLPTMQEIQVRSLGQEDPLEKEMATPSCILDWKIPWTEEPGGLQSIGSQRVRHDWATSLSLSNKKPIFFIRAILVGVRCYLTTVFICISQLINDVEFFLMWLLAINVFSLEKQLFKSFVPF